MAQSPVTPDIINEDSDESSPLKKFIARRYDIEEPSCETPTAFSNLLPTANVFNFDDSIEDPLTLAADLHVLEKQDTILIHRKIDYSGIMDKSVEKFFIKNIDGEFTYYVIENSSACERIFYQEIKMTACDMFNKKIFKMNRYMDFECCFFPICVQHFEVLSLKDDLIGVIDQEWKLFNLSLVVRDGNGMILCRIIRNRIKEFSCRGDIKYKIFAIDGETEIGLITKHRKSNVEGFNPCYTLNFPEDINVHTKVLLIASLFTIHYMYHG